MENPLAASDAEPADQSHSHLPEAAVAEPEGEKGTRFWLAVSLVAGFSIVLILFLTIFVLTGSLHSSNHDVVALSDSLYAAKQTNVDLASSFELLKSAVKYHACCNRHVLNTMDTTITAMMSTSWGYAISTWNENKKVTKLIMLSDDLVAVGKKCPTYSTENPDAITLQRIFKAQSADEVIFAGMGSVSFVKHDCSSASTVTVDALFVIGVLPTAGATNEYLAAYGFIQEFETPGPISIGLINAKRELAWDIYVDDTGYAKAYISNSEFIRLKDGRFALAYTYLQDMPTTFRNATKSAFRGPRVSPIKATVGEEAVVKMFCIAIITLDKDHTHSTGAHFKKSCNENYHQSFSMAETEAGTLLVLGVDSKKNIVLFEVDENDLDKKSTRMIIEENAYGCFSNDGSAFKISANKYAFSMVVARKDQDDLYALALIYDYKNNVLTNNATLYLNGMYISPAVSSDLSRFPDRGPIFTVMVRDEVAVLPVNVDHKVYRQQGREAGFWHMAAAKDGGYVVQKGKQGHQGILWTYYPWQDREEENGRLNCSQIL